MLGGQDRRASAQAGGQSPHVAGGTSPGTPWRPPHADGALRNGEDESPPGGSAGAKRHAPAAPQRRRAAETVNVNVSCLVGAVLSWKRERRVQWGYGAAVTSCSR